MNNLRLLAILLYAALAGGGAGVSGQTVMTLDELFRIAETNSASLRPMFTGEQQADKELSVAKSERLPDINASLSLSYFGNGFTTERDFSDYQAAKIPHLGTGLSLNITQPVYTGGAITSAIDMATLKSTAARLSTELMRENIRFELTGCYLDIYKCLNLRKVLSANTDAAKLVLAEMQARHSQGTVLLNDITRYELLVSNLDLQMVKLNNTLDILNENLVTIAGLPSGTEVIPDTTLLEQSLPLNGEPWWQREALEHSPQLRLAKNSIEMSRKTESLVKAERLPKIGLQAGWTIDGPILVEVPPINRNLSYWWVGVGVTYNLSSLYKSNKSLSKSRIATRRAIKQSDALIENISREIHADHVNYLQAYEELRTLEKSVELAEQNYQVTATRYNAGMALVTDMLDAANARLDAEQQLVNARINIIYYYHKLLFISGKI
ncbi:MAG: TolC family protein [Muribaculaceae bacterium]|nr:TolC family protein [Muribaculaceae bacterium]